MTSKDIKDILAATNPKNDPKYSENLFRFLRKRHFYGQVFYLQTAGEPPFSASLNLAPNIYLGVADTPYICGARLSEILCNGTKAKTWAHPFAQDCQDITEIFWSRYLALGKCAIDPGHKLYGSADRYERLEDGNTRRCLWCGRTEILHIEQRVMVVQDERWLAAV